MTSTSFLSSRNPAILLLIASKFYRHDLPFTCPKMCFRRTVYDLMIMISWLLVSWIANSPLAFSFSFFSFHIYIYFFSFWSEGSGEDGHIVCLSPVTRVISCSATFQIWYSVYNLAVTPANSHDTLRCNPACPTDLYGPNFPSSNSWLNPYSILAVLHLESPLYA